MKPTRRRNPISTFLVKCRRQMCLVVILSCLAFYHVSMEDGDKRLTHNSLADMDQNRLNSLQHSIRNETLSSIENKPKSVRDAGGRQVIWSQARGDRSGAFIQDMLMCHAYAYHNNMVYGGVCARGTSRKFKSMHQELLDAVGLSNVLRYECPPHDDIPLQHRFDYIKDDTAIFTPQYLEYLQNLIQYPKKPERRRIAAHIRRGDISPCRPRTRGYPRYLPNQHFLRLIERYNPQNNSDVFIYSESESYESFDEFRKLGYRVVLDGSIGKVWRGILISDVVILSRSSFSLVPAMMTKGTVVFTPFWHQPLPHWDVVEETFVNETLMEFRRLKATCPKKNKNKQ